MRCRINKVKFNLQRRVGDKPQEVGLGHDFKRHKIQYAYTQGAYILRRGALLIDYKYIFFSKCLNRRERHRHSYRHSNSLELILQFT